MSDLGALHYFLGISVTRNAQGLFLSQKQYAAEVLERDGMASCKPCTTSINTRSTLLAATSPPILNPTHYLSLAGAL